MTPWVVLASLAFEAAVGYPAALHAWIPHPVVWIGRALERLEADWNQPRWGTGLRRLLGCVTVVLLAAAAALTGFGIERVAGRGLVGVLVVAVVGSVGLAQRSLYQHVNAVLIALRQQNLPDARTLVARIVGRDTALLDEAGVAAAALESLAESFNDGIVAPAVWFAIGGLPGVFVYKVLNTADSIIGHKEERWRAFGWAAARLDDLANLVPARLAGALLVLTGGGGWSVMLRDASKHASPNAGWPEAAMAGTLGVQLGGAATYDGVRHERPVFGSGPQPQAAELGRGLVVYVRACGLLWAGLAVMAVATGLLAAQR